MIYYSSEIRWFSDKESSLLELFNAFPGQSSASQARTDRYLTPESESIGIKIREGRMEIKILVAVHHHIFKNHHWDIEDWVKCSYEDRADALKKLAQHDTDTMSWMDITKKRTQKLYSISKKTVASMDFDQRIDRGCTIEYTALKVHNKIPYYSFGFEAFGKDNRTSHRCLITMLNYAKPYLQPQLLSSIICAGYPKFCGKL